ncbi:hypothetical protein WJ96_13140 [Burkholderia ubonensis]|uniref:Carrier domain-containing protein n=2 Tax=Burkholderia ubonensis TaxID=101571 RepID=A0AAW3MSF5_9BURK|nr:hypothetical protein WJ96_13140 [Burkholderia ubonensis]KVZ89027.1 hypothetical protein WL25_23695 [Burkholderia ubonensis]
MRENMFANLKSLTTEQRDALRRRLIERNLLDEPGGGAARARTEFVVDAGDMAAIAAAVPGGADNVEGVYPLTPLQEGMLFHHLLAGDDDPYVLHQTVRFASRDALDRFVAALRVVVERHGILRSAMLWEGLAMPVQVVCRQATLPLVEIEPEAEGASVEWLAAQTALPRHRIDVSAAPLMRVLYARERSGGWLLVIVSHHLIGDRTSLRVMQDELCAITSGARDMRPVAAHFSDYALRVWSAGSERAAAFFRDLLGDVEEPTAPFGLIDAVDLRAPLTDAHFTLGAAPMRRLREQAGRRGIGMPAVVHVAWALVLARASGRDDVVFGTVLSGRINDSAGTADMLGMLINTLPFRVTLRGRSVLECALDAQRLLANLIEHEHAPLSLARRASAIASPMPLSGALLDYRRQPATYGAATPGDTTFVAGGERTSFPLTLSVDDTGDSLECTVQTFEDVEPERIVSYWAEALEQLADALQHAPGRAVAHIDVAPERQTASGDRAGGAGQAAPDTCVHRLFEAQVARSPRAACVVSDAESIDYAELDARASRLAWHLRRRGVTTETRVALCMPRGVGMIVAMLAVMKAGGAYVPLDPAYPKARLRLLARLCRPALVLGEGGAIHGLFTRAGLPVIDPRDIEPSMCPADDAPLSNGHDETPAQTAYVMFTSGSTGEPKGVAVEHRSVAAFVRAQARWCGLYDGDRVLQFASTSFDNSIAEIFPALSVGAAIVLRPDGPVAPDDAFVAYLARHRVTVADLPTAFWHLWAQQLGAGERACAPRPPLRLVLAGGEKARHEALRQWFSVPETAGIRMGDTYGLTEATVNSIVGELTRAHAEAASAPALGQALGDSRAYVLDVQGRLAPVGVTGEICIGGPGVARGYFDRPALTAARFVPDPFGEPGARLYRTGDLGRRTRAGDIEYLGRTDAQLKMRGYRIEPAEIEAALRAAPGVRDAKVLAHGDRLVAYVVGADGDATHTEMLRAHLGDALPSFMMPSVFVKVPALPVNTHGKVDVGALPAPLDDDDGDDRIEPPSTPAEKLVAGIWRDLLERAHVGRHDDFFALGGHSLLAIRVVSRVIAATGAALGVRDVFAHPTLAGFARAAERAKRAEPVVIARGRGASRLSFAQERMWFLSRVDARQSAAYHLTGGLRLAGSVDMDALTAALERIVERHEILRTVFREENGVPRPVVVPVVRGYAWRMHDLSAEVDADTRLAELFARASSDPFDLERGPLLRVTFARLAPDDHVLIASMHHIVADGWSMSVLTSELSALYAHFSAGGEEPLAPLPFQYADYAAWQRERSADLSDDLRFWQDHLRRAPTCLTLPADHARPAVQDHAGASVSFVLDRALAGALRELASRHGATLYMMLVAAYAVLLSRLADQSSVVIGTPVANRPSVELESLIGCFVNTLPLHIDLTGAPTVAELLAQVRNTMLSAHEHQHVPFERIVDALNPPRSRSYNPLFQAMLVWQNTPPGRVALDGLALREIHSDVKTAQCDLSLMMEERSGEIAGTLIYATALFDRATIERYLDAWRAILVAMTTDDVARVDRLALVRGLEVAPASAASPGASRPAPPCLHTRFAQRAAAAPGAIAVVDGTRAVDYGELNAAANRLARHLRTLGVGPGVRVALAMSRGVDLAVGIFAILKAGGAYVPLDPASPKERLREIVEDCRPAAVLIDRSDAGVIYEAADLVVVDVQVDRERWAQLPASDLSCDEVGVASGDAAYVIYTSGSTGRPKGVVVEHAQVASLLASLERALETRASDVWALFHSIAFDVSVWELFGALLTGARLVIVPHAVARTPDAFYRLICRESVTVLSQTPGAFSQLLDVHERAPGAHRLRHVVFAGEPLNPAMLARWFDSNGTHETAFTDMYGITETAIYTTLHRLSEDDARAGAARSVGHAIEGRRVYVLDERLQPVPADVLGEIWIGGEGVARCYHQRPALTAERFVPDPFTKQPGERMYRSGDLGRLRANGELEFVGRADEQVKIRGFRVEPGEVATRLAAHPAVGQAVVRARADEEGGVRLVAYFTVHRSFMAPAPETLRAYLGDRLPDYMIPAAYVCVDAFALTLNGKTDYAALPPPAPTDYPVREYELPQDDTETWLAQAWASLLGVARVGRHDDFFALGGHSLLIAQLMARIREAFDVDLPMSEVFEAPVLHEFAARVVDARLAQFDAADLARLAAVNLSDEAAEPGKRDE